MPLHAHVSIPSRTDWRGYSWHRIRASGFIGVGPTVSNFATWSSRLFSVDISVFKCWSVRCSWAQHQTSTNDMDATLLHPPMCNELMAMVVLSLCALQSPCVQPCWVCPCASNVCLLLSQRVPFRANVCVCVCVCVCVDHHR